MDVNDHVAGIWLATVERSSVIMYCYSSCKSFFFTESEDLFCPWVYVLRASH